MKSIYCQFVCFFFLFSMSFTCMYMKSWHIMYYILCFYRKQCIESEKLFHFLKDLVAQTTPTSQKDNRSMSMWPLYR